MTNVSATPEKIATRAQLFEIAVQALANDGWSVERMERSGKSSVRKISKNGISSSVSIRTSQDAWIAFPRNLADDKWATLDEMDYVVAASVNERENPKFAQIHLIPGEEIRSRFDRAYAARRKAGYSLPVGRGIWLSLYENEANEPATLVGAGVGLAYPPIAIVSLSKENSDEIPKIQTEKIEDAPLTILEAKRRLALSLGVNESDIKISINS